MAAVNYILILLGVIVTLIGVISIFFPGLTKIINAPGGPRVKSIIAIIVGIIIFFIGLLVNIPIN
jgi:hypothetical protein